MCHGINFDAPKRRIGQGTLGNKSASNSSKTAIKAWIELNKPETRTPENDLYTTIDESYSPTKNYISKDFAPSTDTKYYNSSSKNCNLQKGGTNTTGWTERLDISTEQWKSTLEKLQQNGQK